MIKKIIYLLLLSNIAYAQSSLDEYTRKLDKIDRIEKDLNILQKQFYRGTKNNKVIIEEQPIGNLEIRISQIEEKIRSLIGDIEKLEHTLQIQEDNFKKFSEDIEFRFKELSVKNTKDSNELSENVIEENPQENQKNIASNNIEQQILGKVKIKDTEKAKLDVEKARESDKTDFDEAFALLKANQFKEAENNFKQIVEQTKNNEIKSRSLYWLGEINVAKKDYEKAAINFLQSYKALPKHIKSAESLIKLVNTLRQLNKNNEACNIVNKIYKDFPNLNEKLTLKVKEESNKLGCK